MRPEQKRSIMLLPLLLQLSRNAVGIKLIASQEEYDDEPARTVARKLPYCVAVQCAARGYSIKLDKNTSGCPGSSRAFGLTPPDEAYYSGERGWKMGLYRDRDVAASVAAQFRIVQQPNYGVAVKPLTAWQTPPDCVMIIGSPYTIMRVVQGYTYEYGMQPHFNMTGNQGVCIECTAYPLLANQINASFLCSGTRHHARWSADEAGVGFPFFLLEGIVRGIYQTVNATEPDSRKKIILAALGEHGYPTDGIMEGGAYYL